MSDIGFDENLLLLLIFVAVACAIAAPLAWLCDWLEEKFPWREPW